MSSFLPPASSLQPDPPSKVVILRTDLLMLIERHVAHRVLRRSEL